MLGCDSEAEYGAYKAIVRPLLEYACVVWSPHAVKDVNLFRGVLHRGFVAVAGNKLRTLGLFLIMCAIESCVYHPYLPGGTICRCVLFRTFFMLVLLSFQTTVHTTLCLRVAIILPPSSLLNDILILSVFVVCGTKYQSVFWELKAVLFLVMLFTDISVIIFKCNLLLLICCFVDVIIIIVDLFCFVSVILCVFGLVVVCVLY